jgi:hypothetical protein
MAEQSKKRKQTEQNTSEKPDLSSWHNAKPELTLLKKSADLKVKTKELKKFEKK